jgi:molybdopterin-guanine dinucleotide biosynthesis protein A
MTPVAGIVLAGGRSSRMGRPKAALDWEGTTLVDRVAGVLAATLDGPVVVVRAPGQELPELGADIEVADDARAGRGPLEGIAAGLRAVGGRAATAYVSATDVPLLRPAFVRTVVAALDAGADAAVPAVGDRIHPLAGAYRTSILPAVERMLREGRLRALDLLDEIEVRWLSEPELRASDPDLASLRNLNTPGEYEAALAERR